MAKRKVAPHWGAWIEIARGLRRRRASPVAPHWGAWIEIRETFGGADDLESHPTGVRGLKSYDEFLPGSRHLVAPHWGAWIEIGRARVPPPRWWRRTPLGCVD